ncbi:twin-arginine translocase TatA/TatE family subunit [candidate division KSB1 bacterium]|nr:twin-arginine translocase TatA/TatE family subunit [candidate division KSB1 bacterium]
MIGNIGIGELMVILMIILLLFGAKKVPEIAHSLGRSISEFKKAMNSTVSDIQDAFETHETGNLKSK